ncbi:DUF3604 domain-containing protein [bacterium]|nr:DUF3604 domain-containing protein [bacterium]
MYGKINLKPSKKTVVNSLSAWVFSYAVGDIGFKRGGKLLICMRHSSDWSNPQFDSPQDEGYTTVKSNKKVKFTAEFSAWKNFAYHPWQHILEITLQKRKLEKGDNITISLGDRSLGSPGIRAQSFAEPEFKFRVFVNPDGEGKFHELKDKSLHIPLVSAPFSEVKTTLPSQPAEGYLGRINICALDQYGNTTALPKGEKIIFINDRKKIGINDSSKQRIEVLGNILQHAKDKTIRVTLYMPDINLEIKSNPCIVTKTKKKLLWGEIHAHSYLCDGIRWPLELLQFARDEARLDFAAVSSHDWELNEDIFNKLKIITNKLYSSGKFTTFSGFEWSGQAKNGGDHNIYFADYDGELLSCGHTQYNYKKYYSKRLPNSLMPPWIKPWMLKKTPYENLKNVYSKLENCNAMIIPHGGGRCANLDYHHPKLEPILEITSCHQTYEKLAWESLQRGYRMGFIGGSDDHRGNIGDSHSTLRTKNLNLPQHSGLVAVYSNECTRESIWSAFFRKEVYATTGARIVLDFTINGHRMGASIRQSKAEKPRYIRVRASGAAPIRCVEIWRNAKPLMSWERNYLDYEVEYKDKESMDKIKWDNCILSGKEVRPCSSVSGIPIKRAETVYYVKVIQFDGHTAWSSPIWIDLG